MSILIKGMKMPKSCLLCPFGDEFGKCCVNAELEDANELTHSCPLVELPTIDPVKHGKWETEVRTIRGHKIAFFACSVCGRNADGEYHYCPNCGAKMDGKEQNNETERTDD